MGVRSRRELYIVRKVIRRVLAHHNVSLLTCWGKQDTEKIARVCNQVVRIFRKNNPNWNLGMARVAVQHTLEDSGKTIRRKAKGYKSQPISYSRSAPRPKKYAPDFSEHLVESEKEEEEASMIPEPNNGMGDTAGHRDRQRAASSAISHASKQTTNQRGTDRTGQNGAPTEKSGAEKVSRQNHESGRVSSSPARVDPLPQTPGNRFSGRSAALSTPYRQAPAAPTTVKTPVGSAHTSNQGLMGPPPTPHRQIVKTVKSVASGKTFVAIWSWGDQGDRPRPNRKLLRPATICFRTGAPHDAPLQIVASDEQAKSISAISACERGALDTRNEQIV